MMRKSDTTKEQLVRELQEARLQLHALKSRKKEHATTETLLRQRVNELSALTRLAKDMAAHLATERVVRSAQEQVKKIINPDVTVIYLREHDQLLLQDRHEQQVVFPEIKKIGQCLCGIAAQDGEPVYSENIRKDPRCTLHECREAGFVSFAALPLVVKGSVIGVLGIAARAERDFSENAEFIGTLAGHIAVALHNARLYEQAQHASEQLKAHEKEITALNQRLMASMQQMKAQEQDLRESEEKIRRITENMRDLVAQLDADGRFIYISPSVYHSLAYRPEDLIGEIAFARLHPEDRDRVINEFQTGKATGDVREVEYRYAHADGHYIWFESARNYLRDNDGKVIGVILSSRDISRRKRAEEALSTERQQLLSIFDSMDEVVYIADPETYELLYTNNAFRKLFGGDRKKKCYEILQRKNTPCEFCSNPFIFGDNLGKAHIWDFQNLRTQRWFRCTDRAIQWTDGRLVRFEMAVDITDSKAAEKTLAVRLKYEEGIAACSQALLTKSPDPVTAALHHLLKASDASRVYIFENFNDQQNRLCMRQTHEACAENVSPQIENPELQCLPYCQGFSRWEKELSQNSFIAGIVRDFPAGERMILEPQNILSLLVLPIQIDGKWIGFIGFDDTIRDRAWDQEDIRLLRMAAEMIGGYMQRTSAEAALRESEERFNLAFAAINDGLWDWDLTTGNMYFSPQWYLMRGYEPYEMPSCYETLEKLVHPADLGLMRESIEKFLKGGQGQYDIEYRMRAKSGNWIWTRSRGKAVSFDEQGRPVRLVGTHTDITKRKQAEEALRESEERYRTVADFTHDWEHWISPDGTYLYVSPAFERITGYPREALLQNPDFLASIIPAADAAVILEHMKTQEPADAIPIEFRIKTRTGQERWLSHVCQRVYNEDGRYLGRRGSNRDITEEKHIREEAVREAHLASIGELAAGVAHEINNPIMAIINCTQLIVDEYQDRGADTNIPQRVLKESYRVGTIVRNLLSFARGTEDEEPVPTSLQELFADSMALYAKQFQTSNIVLQEHFDRDIPRAMVQPHKIQQVFVNLLSNAFYALNRKYPQTHPDKMLEVNAAPITIEAKPCVRVVLHDHGTGIPEHLMDRICNAFFSTKPRGEGTGLGLSISHSIIKNQGGRLLFESREGLYTKVIIDLPAALPEQEKG